MTRTATSIRAGTATGVMGERVRLNTRQRSRIISAAALQVARSVGLANVNHQNVSEACTVTTSRMTVRRVFKTLGDLQLAAVDESKGHEKRSLHLQAKKLGLVAD